MSNQVDGVIYWNGEDLEGMNQSSILNMLSLNILGPHEYVK